MTDKNQVEANTKYTFPPGTVIVVGPDGEFSFTTNEANDGVDDFILTGCVLFGPDTTSAQAAILAIGEEQ